MEPSVLGDRKSPHCLLEMLAGWERVGQVEQTAIPGLFWRIHVDIGSWVGVS